MIRISGGQSTAFPIGRNQAVGVPLVSRPAACRCHHVVRAPTRDAPMILIFFLLGGNRAVQIPQIFPVFGVFP